MPIQRLYCKPGQHHWQRESQRGKPPKACLEHKGQPVIEADSNAETPEIDEPTSTVLEGTALADHLIMSLTSRGMLLSQQKESDKGTLVYTGPRY